jgi:hypothetical protein
MWLYHIRISAKLIINKGFTKEAGNQVIEAGDADGISY